MRGVVAICLGVFCLAGCQSSGSPEQAVATPNTVAVASYERPEAPSPQKLNQPPNLKAKDLAPPVSPFQHGPGMSRAASKPELPSPTVSPRLPQTGYHQPSYPQPSYPQYRPASDPNRPSPGPFSPGAVRMSPAPGAIGHRPAPPTYYVPPRVERPMAAAPRYSAVPELPRPPLQRPAPPSAYPVAAPQPAYPTAPPRLPGQGPSAFAPSAMEQRRLKEKQLEQAYLQSRADALNMKYHGGRPVLGPHSSGVLFSASAPPSDYLNRPSIPGSKMDLTGAFRASEVKRQEWHNYRDQPPTGMPQMPSPAFANPAMPSHPMPRTFP